MGDVERKNGLKGDAQKKDIHSRILRESAPTRANEGDTAIPTSWSAQNR